jgi:Fic-DOC domain mobile mystery protein B
MYGDVWRWAGQFRKTPRNIGVDAWKIEPDLKCFFDDVRYWIDHQTCPT